MRVEFGREGVPHGTIARIAHHNSEVHDLNDGVLCGEPEHHVDKPIVLHVDPGRDLFDRELAG